jgi:hypothetical protein
MKHMHIDMYIYTYIYTNVYTCTNNMDGPKRSSIPHPTFCPRPKNSSSTYLSTCARRKLFIWCITLPIGKGEHIEKEAFKSWEEES